MKNILILALGLALSASAFAYEGNTPDPKNGQGDIETKLFVKSAAAGFSDNISKGQMLAYGVQTGENDGYTMTHIIGQTVPGQNEVSCLSLDDVATGDTGYHLCQTKGFVGDGTNIPASLFAAWSNTTNQLLEAGRHACVSTTGQIRGCAITGAEATVDIMIIPLSLTNAVGSSGTKGLQVVLNLQ